METSEKLGGKEFVKAAKNNGLEEMLTKKNVTVFLPTDASFADYSEQMFESVSLHRDLIPFGVSLTPNLRNPNRIWS